MPIALVIDDAADIRLLLRELLVRAGFGVLEADSGTAALDLLSGEHADVAVLDVQMPEMDGWATLEAIRTVEGTRDLPVVLCTVKAHPSDAVRAWELGCDGYLSKPFTIKELVDEVASVAARSPERRRAVREARLARARHDLAASSVA